MKKYQATAISSDLDYGDDNSNESFEFNPESISYEAKEYKVQNTEDED